MKRRERDAGPHHSLAVLGYAWRSGRCSAGRHGVVYYMERADGVTYAVKQVDGSDAGGECAVLVRLNTLASAGHCPNFAFLHQHWRAPDEGACGDTRATTTLMVMEYGGVPLKGHARLSEAATRSLLMQLLFALHAAETLAGLRHHQDLHLGNMLVRPLPPGVEWLVYQSEALVWYIPTASAPLMLKLIDFGEATLAREGAPAPDVSAWLTLDRIWNANDLFSVAPPRFQELLGFGRRALRKARYATFADALEHDPLFAPLRERPTGYTPERASIWKATQQQQRPRTLTSGTIP